MKNSHPELVVPPTLQTTVVQDRARAVLPARDVGGRPALSKIHKCEALTHVGGRQPSRDSVSKTELSVRSTTTGDGRHTKGKGTDADNGLAARVVAIANKKPRH